MSTPQASFIAADWISAFVAMAAFAVSLISLYLSIKALGIQRDHNIRSLRPMLRVSPADYEGKLAVELKNNGPGPAIISNIAVSDGRLSHPSIRHWMPDLPEGLCWDVYVGPITDEDESMSPGESILLIALSGSDTDSIFTAFRDECRSRLGSLTLVVTYRDAYDNELVMKKPLRWFARAHAKA